MCTHRACVCTALINEISMGTAPEVVFRVLPRHRVGRSGREFGAPGAARGPAPCDPEPSFWRRRPAPASRVGRRQTDRSVGRRLAAGAASPFGARELCRPVPLLRIAPRHSDSFRAGLVGRSPAATAADLRRSRRWFVDRHKKMSTAKPSLVPEAFGLLDAVRPSRWCYRSGHLYVHRYVTTV